MHHPPPPALGREAWVEVDLGALRHNHRVLAASLPPGSGLGVVVKADGYGHGLGAAARIAVEAGAALLMVATLDEGLAIRRAGIAAPVLVLYPVPPASVADAADARLALTVNGRASAESLVAAVESRPRHVRMVEAHLEVDTGMTRDGAPLSDVVSTARLLVGCERVRLAGTWSHVATPEDPDQTGAQVATFERALDLLRESNVDPGVRHLSASGGLLVGSVPTYDLVRAGIAWYGVVPDEWSTQRPDLAASLRPALSLHARAIRVAEVPTGTRVGYGGAWTAPRPSRIATLPLGYADGYPRQSWPGGVALVRGQRVPLVGRVSTDALTVDVTDARDVLVGDVVTLIGAQGRERLDAVDVAAARGSIPWDAISVLGARLARVYLDGERVDSVREPLVVA